MNCLDTGPRDGLMMGFAGWVLGTVVITTVLLLGGASPFIAINMGMWTGGVPGGFLAVNWAIWGHPLQFGPEAHR